jgi:hypothetical protein
MPLDQVLMLFGVVLIPVSGVLAALWITARARARRAEAMVQQVTMALAVRGDRLGADVGPAIDAIAAEVERLGESQRFMTRLLEERARDGVPSPMRVVTPH